MIWSIKKTRNSLSPKDLLKKAANFGIHSILLEGGAELAASFITAGLIDKYVFFISPKLIGRGKEAIGKLGIKKMADAIEFSDVTYDEFCNPDIIFTGYPAKPKSKRQS